MLQVNLREVPRVTVMGQVRQRENWQPQGREQHNHMMIFVIEGDLRFEFEEKAVLLTAGDYILIPRKTYYRPYSENGCQFYFVHFENENPVKVLNEAETKSLREQRQKLFAGRSDPSAYALPMDHHEFLMIPMTGTLGRIREKIVLLLAECEIERYGLTPQKKTGIDLRVAEILNLLDQNTDSSHMQTGAAPPMLTRIILFVHQHYSETVTLSRLSEVFGVSKQYIAMLFRQYMGTSVTRYVTRLKLDHALDLLRYSNFPIGEIADRLGFGSAYYFSRVFRKHFNMTPSEYIQTVGERKKDG